jgi:hypothetical protein
LGSIDPAGVPWNAWSIVDVDGAADRCRDKKLIGSLVLPGFATTVAERRIDVEDDENGTVDPGANGP